MRVVVKLGIMNKDEYLNIRSEERWSNRIVY